MTHHVLDVRNLLCPMPVIKLQNLIARLSSGDTVDVQATDPGVLQDIPAWCRINGHEVLTTSTTARELLLTVRVKAA